MKSLVVYYSLEGHTRLLAEIIAKEAGADIFELSTVKPSTAKSGFFKYFLGGMRANMKQKPALKNPPPDLTVYELIFIGTPVWGSRMTPAVNSFISGSSLAGKNVMLFASSGGGDAGKCFDVIKSQLTGCKIIGEIVFKQSDLDNKDVAAARIKPWLKNAGV